MAVLGDFFSEDIVNAMLSMNILTNLHSLKDCHRQILDVPIRVHFTVAQKRKFINGTS